MTINWQRLLDRSLRLDYGLTHEFRRRLTAGGAYDLVDYASGQRATVTAQGNVATARLNEKAVADSTFVRFEDIDEQYGQAMEASAATASISDEIERLSPLYYGRSCEDR